MLVTFIRHGESTDNLRPVWAGWADAPLSNHGMNQARALGQHWASTRIDTVYCSDLKRAHSTAKALVAGQPDSTSLEPIVTPLLREQNFGIAEGKPWAAAPDSSPNAKSEAEQVYYTIHTRHGKFEDGESLDDLARRAEEAIDTTVWPHVVEALRPRKSAAANDAGERPEDAHIVLVSHGLAISELAAALLRRSPPGAESSPHTRNPRSLRGLPNTGWTQVCIDIQPVTPDPATSATVDDTEEAPLVQMKIESIYLQSVNNSPHLRHVKRQSGGIGSAAHDEKQRQLREFFGGGGTSSSSS
ncbi:hypothetical protein M408DRAFT_204117 [Serendipita vermifera MAFF 305830]|uniref:Phosphoglycerate mutase n=1 Tax=Serendipita vermifera MAFF 305830 TaxID=933852 RepID=A0A0C3B0P4_SERVB|nr:hypothetical protein M408DRAFT_204117 [Serendipita vermifera MAFF 305830]